jgi:hypothetical protein
LFQFPNQAIRQIVVAQTLYGNKSEDNCYEQISGKLIRELIDTAFTKGLINADRAEISDFLISRKDYKEKIEYIRRIFNSEYTEFFLSDGRRVGYKAYQNVLSVWEGSYSNPKHNERIEKLWQM